MLRTGRTEPLKPRMALRWWACAKHPLTSLVLIVCVFANVAHADDRAQVIARAKPSIAKVIVTGKDNKSSIGTSFLFTSTVRPAPGGESVTNGNLLTNCHVVNGALKVEVQFMNAPEGDAWGNPLSSRLEAKVLGCDQASDLAVLEVGVGPAAQIRFHLPPPLPFAKPEDIHAGDEVLTLGFAVNLGGEPSASRGIISALNRSFPSEFDCEGETDCEPGRWSGLIQTDATINHGNSGGPLLNMKGEVVGINTYTTGGKHPALNVFYSRNVETAAPFAKMLLANGRVIRAKIGVTDGEKVPPVPGTIFLDHGGIKILALSPLGQKAGLRVGDIITYIQKKPREGWNVEDIGSFANLLAFIQPGTTVSITVSRPQGFPTVVNVKTE
jgi:S1-C subfamily serine protease